MTCVTTSTVDVALLGCGNVGAAFARLVDRRARSSSFTITRALVRDPSRARDVPQHLPLSADARTVFAPPPDVLVELLGGGEPARTLILEALQQRVPVVTANKTLLARHGAELREAAAATRTPLLCEAAVLAGVPFLGTVARRPEAAAAHGLVGIVNGTCNYVLTACATGACEIGTALLDAQRLGYAEPDPRNDIAGIDGAEKLSVLLQHFGAFEVHPDLVRTTPIDNVTRAQVVDAQAFGGVIKPIVYANWQSRLEAFVGPAFVPDPHPLARVAGVDSAVLINGPHGRLLFQGPGAGPDVTAAAVLDDVSEITAGTARVARTDLTARRPVEPDTGWMVTLEGARLPRPAEIADLFAPHGVFARATTRRTTAEGHERQSWLVWPAPRASVDGALRDLTAAASLEAYALRTLEVLS